MEYKDFRFERGDYQKAEEYTGSSALVLGIKNLLLSKPGNFPFNPSIGMNIKKYQFDLLDDVTLSEIKLELNRQIAQYIPSIDGVDTYIGIVKDENDLAYLTISVSVILKGETTRANFIVKNENDTVSVFNEIY